MIVDHLDRADPEWDRAWRGLLDVTGDQDAVMAHPATREVWQYMGSSWSPSDGWTHGFRHRTHPSDDGGRSAGVPASAEWAAARPITDADREEWRRSNEEVPF